MQNSPNLIWLRSFECAARHLSFTVAAQELGITQSALSLHVRSLEAHLGCPLFFRAARHLSLTEVGQAYAFSIRRALGDIDLSTTSLFGTSQTQDLIVRVPISTATMFLAHRLPEFSCNHPNVSIRLISSIWAESAGREQVDFELRLGTGDWNDAPFEKISDEHIVPIACSKNGATTLSGKELLQGPQIQILGFQDMWLRYLAALDVEYATASSPVAVDTTIAAVDVVAAGGGYAVVLERFAKSAIDTGRTIAIVGDRIPIEESHFIVRGQKSKPHDSAVKIFEGWIKEKFAS
ncbi:LysR family transcriptional regulator [Loktanella sp. Alg231-35]|uniref:LysR family transcriptional regulator n=1 Tax=Loktanella sp. Alg231-35 TaxID=1922220 RepID=UPI000D54AFB7|nr:LysR family transcriptional regulator [Loktanella sp. Alg231-35]